MSMDGREFVFDLPTFELPTGSHLMMAQLAELRTNRDDADVTLNCQGDVIMAHSLILKTR